MDGIGGDRQDGSNTCRYFMNYWLLLDVTFLIGHTLPRKYFHNSLNSFIRVEQLETPSQGYREPVLCSERKRRPFLYEQSAWDKVAVGASRWWSARGMWR
eukprot:1378901-Amorphochlora_amoeboformis.AAC.1